MSTTNVGFVVPTSATLQGSTVQSVPSVLPLNGVSANQQVEEGFATRLDLVNIDLSIKNGYAKNAAAYLTLTGSTPITLNLLALAATTGVVVAGDSSFATVNQLVFTNTGAVDLVVSPAGSNPFPLQLGGTSPTITVAAGSQVTIQSVAGLATSGTVKSITVTPTAGGTLGVCVGGA